MERWAYVERLWQHFDHWMVCTMTAATIAAYCVTVGKYLQDTLFNFCTVHVYTYDMTPFKMCTPIDKSWLSVVSTVHKIQFAQMII